MEKLLLILNPCSGQKKGKKYLADIIDIFNRAGYTVITYITAERSDAEKAVLKYAAQVDRIVCCGGDGTFQETLSGVMKSGVSVPVGYIPAGSTNDFAASLHLRSDLLQAARDIVAGTPTALDAGLFNDRYFSYIASFGIFTKSSYATPQSMKNMIGHAAYVLSGIQELSQLHTYPVHLELSDGTVIDDSFLFGAISNSTSVGGILTLDDKSVDMADGKFELLLIRAPKDVFELRDCVRALQQKTYNSAMITFTSVASVKIQASETMNWTLDGEQEVGHSQITVQCIPKAINIVK